MLVAYDDLIAAGDVLFPGSERNVRRVESGRSAGDEARIASGRPPGEGPAASRHRLGAGRCRIDEGLALQRARSVPLSYLDRTAPCSLQEPQYPRPRESASYSSPWSRVGTQHRPCPWICAWPNEWIRPFDSVVTSARARRAF